MTGFPFWDVMRVCVEYDIKTTSHNAAARTVTRADNALKSATARMQMRRTFSGATRVVIPELLLPRFGFSDEDSGVGPVLKLIEDAAWILGEFAEVNIRIYSSMFKRDLLPDLHQSSGATLISFPCFPGPTDMQSASQWTAYFALKSLPKPKSKSLYSRRLSARAGTRLESLSSTTTTQVTFLCTSFVSGTCPAFGHRTGVTDSVAVVAIYLGDPCARASNVYQTVCTPPKYDVKIAVLVVGGGVFPALERSFPSSYANAGSQRHDGLNEFAGKARLDEQHCDPDTTKRFC
ncbi:hypothetical protein C8R43DRAFT_1102472 [Mycena crocata]|nr:hypothetical protein C8R43DRAFT_1102472 [Mycena crocata]